ncbi:MAG: hypothetical protein LUG62_08615 [Clostridiales bacterium]|nr:hypothetical protein [Clostridiales bacterium]
MGYYPIKCIHCMRPFRMEDRCVKLDPEEIRPLNPEMDKNTALNHEYEINEGAAGNRRQDRQILYRKIGQLREEGFIEDEEIQNINISPEYRNIPECRKDFIQSVVVKDLEISGQKISGTVRKFYCPFCHNEIIPMAGKMPMYLVSLLGPSSAGKTVYLTILHMLLSNRVYSLPQGMLSFTNFGAVGKEFQKFALNIRKKNELPSTTQENRKDPYLLRVSYTAYPNSQETNKECLLGLIDMRGEMLQGEHNEALMDYNVPQFREADGFIMMVDPETLEGVYNRLPGQLFGGRSIEQLDMILGSMKEVIMSCITDAIGRIQRPSVVALAKTDILQKNYAQLGIPLNQPVIAPNFRMVPGTNLGAAYYEPMNLSTRACIRYLSGTLTNFLDTTFRNPYYLSLSALGNMVRIAGNRIDNHERIRPLRVEEPLLRLLMEFNFIPHFYQQDFYYDSAAVMEKWGRERAEIWTPPESAANADGGKKRHRGHSDLQK